MTTRYRRRDMGAARPSLLAVALLASAATARATGDVWAFVGSGGNRHAHGRARALAQTCPSGSAYDTTLAACAVMCDGGYVRDDTANTTIDATTVLGRCEPCPPGSAREPGTADACIACPVGTSNSRSGQIACVPCSYQGSTKYANATGAVTCLECPAATAQRVGDERDAQGATLLSGLSLDQCVCESGTYDPVANRTGAPCEACPKGAVCAGDTRRPTSKPLYYGCPPPHDDFFLRCHRMINNQSPCLGENRCMEGFEKQSCSRCASGFYRFQRNCVACPPRGAGSLIAAYMFLLVAFYVVKKLSTIVLPSMYIILTYIQCLSIVGNRQGWGTERTKTFLKSAEIVNFPLDLFIPSCAAEMPFVHKAAFFTVTPIFYVLVDVVLVENFVKYAWPRLADALAFCLVGLIRVKYVFGAEDGRKAMSAEDEAAGARGRLRHEIRSSRFLGGVVQAWYLASPVEAEEAIDKTFGSRSSLAKRTMLWAGKRAGKSVQKRRDRGSDVRVNGTDERVSDDASQPSVSTDAFQNTASSDAPLTFAQKCAKHFFEDMRLMYVATTSALLKTLRCTPVGDRDLSTFWLSSAWFGTGSKSVLSADPAQTCWEGEHAKLVPYFVLMLILYGVGYPVATLLVLTNCKNPEKRRGWHPKVYGRLYRRFEPQYYYWEVVYLVRRLCLVSFRTLMNDRRAEVYAARTMQGWQALCFVVTLCAALLAQFYAHPFKLEHMDLLDATLLCCLFLVVWISMAFEVALKDTQEVAVLEFLVFVVVAISVLVSAYALLLDAYHSYTKHGRQPPRWIVWVVFTCTPPPVLVGLGLASKSTAAQIERLAGEIDREKARGGDAGAEAAAGDGGESGGASVRRKSARRVVGMERKLERLKKRLSEDGDTDDEDATPRNSA